MEDLTVHIVLRVEEVGIAGGNDGLSVLFAQFYDPPVQISEFFFIFEFPLFNEETVIADGLDLQIIVELDNLGDICIRTVVDDGPHELSCLAGGADE